jgi:hypothetical protein
VLSPADRNAAKIGMGKYTLKFTDKKLERRYMITYIKDNWKRLRKIYFLLVIYFGTFILGEGIVAFQKEYTFSRLGVFIGFLATGGLFFTSIIRQKYFQSTMVVMVLAMITKLIYDYVTPTETALSAAVVPVVISTLFNMSAFRGIIMNLIHYFIWVIRAIYLEANQTDNDNLFRFYIIWSHVFLHAGITVLLCILAYRVNYLHHF